MGVSNADVDALFKGLKLFNEGVQSLAIARSLHRASGQIEDIRKVVDEDQDVRAGKIREVNEDLARRLVALNVSGGQIKAAMFGGGVEPPKRLPTTPFQASLVGKSPEEIQAAGTAGVTAQTEAKQIKADEAKDKLVQSDLQRLVKLASVPSSRRRSGRVQVNIDVADALLTLFTGKVPEGENLARMTVEEREKVFNKLSAFEVEETAVVLSRLLTQAAPTQGGIENLTADSIIIKANRRLGEIRNRPEGAQAGKFIESFYQTVVRERGLNVAKQKQIFGTFRAAFGRAAAAQPEAVNTILTPDRIEFDLDKILKGGEGTRFIPAPQLEAPPLFAPQPGVPGSQQGPRDLPSTRPRKRNFRQFRKKGD